MLQKFRGNVKIYINYLIILFAGIMVFNKNVANIILYIILVLFLFIPNLKNKIKLLFKSKIFQIFLLFLFYNFLIILWTPDKIYGLYYVKKYFKYFFIFILL